MPYDNDNIAIFAESRRLWETDPALRESIENSRARTRLVAEAFREALGERACCFETVEFAVAGRDENYKAFFNAFAGWN